MKPCLCDALQIRMPGAIVLVNSKIGEEATLLEGLCSMDEVREAYLVYGVYDIVVRVYAESVDALESIIAGRIRQLPGVMSTLTLVISRECILE